MNLAILIVTHNNQESIESVLLRLKGESFPHQIFVLDNASADETLEILHRHPELTIVESQQNLGFCAANNLLLNRAYNLSFSHFLFLNPDAAPLAGSVKIIMDLAEKKIAEAYTPKILRCDNKMELLTPKTIDATGIYFTKNFRHLDRGSSELDNSQYDKPGFVSGGTGACLLVTRFFVEKVSFISPDNTYELFDERFFAYREDAELALRANRFGLRYFYVPSAVFCHVRKVIPERRNQLSPFINALSVRNRLLLLLNHYLVTLPPEVQVKTFFRNILVFGYAFLFEPQSRNLLFQLLGDYSAYIKRRQEISRRSEISSSDYSAIFG